ncbi:arsenate reductase (glutaredoxin) [Paracoccus salipaludis]|uniref:Arsenate reductase n=1 Tax=Paracoccus salipaludis TaxID=2032623 RepID=A0A2A2GHN0_9RHOB|nr:arsenate reductase (glutaredoxin) [Paracoccus salipaludis]PAU97116.1 arsenate reductase (glutaredoxin) [Paracoccus salipaludis]
MTTIWHHPNCTTSRRVLQMLQDGGETPEVIDYRNDPPDRETLRQWIADAGLTVRQALRRRNTPFDDLGLGDPDLTDDQLLDSVLAHPILLERPFVRTSLGTRLCRPPERVIEIMANPPARPAQDGDPPA